MLILQFVVYVQIKDLTWVVIGYKLLLNKWYNYSMTYTFGKINNIPRISMIKSLL